MEVKVEIPKMRKVVRLEVEADHSLDSILEIICKDLGLGRKESWSLMWHDVETSDYSRTIQQLGVREGDSFQLVEKARLPPQVAVPPLQVPTQKFCINCATSLPAYAQFCKKCGSKQT